jgi:hypothetical protein
MRGYADPDKQMIVEFYAGNIQKSKGFFKSVGLRFAALFPDLER